jgi:cytoskeleton protein RodZ
MAASGETTVLEQEGATELNLGVKLRYAREAQSLSLDDIAAELKISPEALLALEECRFDAVGPPVFAKGYLKQYASLLGLDARDIIADYERAAGNQGIDISPSKAIKLRDDRQIVVWIVAAVMLVGLTALLLLWWFRQPGQLWGPPATETVDQPSAGLSVPSEPVAATQTGRIDAAPLREPARSGIAVAESASEPELASMSGETPAAPSDVADVATSAEPDVTPDPIASSSALPSTVDAGLPPPGPAAIVSAPESREAPEASREAPVAETLAADTAPEETPSAGATADEPSLEVVFVEDSWTEITADSGDRLFYRLGEAGTSQQFTAVEGMRFLFGNAGGVEIRLDGEPVAIPAAARRGNLAQFELSDLQD